MKIKITPHSRGISEKKKTVVAWVTEPVALHEIGKSRPLKA
jgi:hypothetical protein